MVKFVCALMALAFDDLVLCMDASNNFVEQTDTGASAPSPNQGLNIMQPGAEQFSMKVPNTKVNLFLFFFSSVDTESNASHFALMLSVGCFAHWQGW